MALQDVSVAYHRAKSFLQARESEALPRRLARKFLVELNPLLPTTVRKTWTAKLRAGVAARNQAEFQRRLAERVASLSSRGGVHTFEYGGRSVRMSLPQADADFVQRRVLMEDRFFEQHFLELSRAYLPAGSVVADVGANIGNHALYWALQPEVSRVLAFEPVPPTFRTLDANVRLNGLEGRVECRELAIGRTAARTEIFVPISNPCLSRLAADFSANLSERPEVERFDVRVLSLDEACRDLTRLDLLKIDVEGFEEDVLVGARELLQRLRPALMIEVWPKQRPQLEGLLRELGYRANQELDENNVIYVHAERSPTKRAAPRA